MLRKYAILYSKAAGVWGKHAFMCIREDKISMGTDET